MRSAAAVIPALVLLVVALALPACSGEPGDSGAPPEKKAPDANPTTAVDAITTPVASDASTKGDGDATKQNESPSSPATDGGGASSGPGLRSAEAVVERVRSLRKQYQYDEALAVLADGLAKNPIGDVRAELRFEVGQTQYLQGQNLRKKPVSEATGIERLETALATFRAVTKEHPRAPKAASATYMTGSTLLMLGKQNEALAQYARAFDEYPADPARSRSLLRVGIVQSGLDQIPAARRTYARVIRDFPDRTADVKRAQKYLRQLSIVGRPYTPLRAAKWLNGVVDSTGIRSLDGEVRILVFVATWCTNCSKEAPNLRRLIATWGDEGVAWLGVIDPNDPKSTESPELYIEKTGFEFMDVAFVPEDRVWDAYLANSLPGLVVIDRAGTIRWRGHPGFFPSGLIRKVLAE